MNRILVIGASGFVGRAAMKALKNAGELHAVYKQKTPDVSGPVTWHRADVLNRTEADDIIGKVAPTHLLQLAWCTGHGTYWKDVANLKWLSANLGIAESFIKNGGRRCLFTGTSAEYDWSGNDPLHEYNTPLVPQGLYGGAKLGSYWALKKYFEQENISWLWARVFNPFGPGEDARRLIPKTCIRLLNGETIQFDAGTTRRDFLHVDEVGSALAAALLSEVNGPVNIGSGEALSIRDVITRLAACYGLQDRVSFDTADGNGQIPGTVVADVSRLHKECNWQPELNFSQRLKETCEWWKLNQKQTKII